jgi:hypothetical protein
MALEDAFWAGIHLAERMQWHMLAQLLWAFRIMHVVDEKGVKTEIDTDAYGEKSIKGAEAISRA